MIDLAEAKSIVQDVFGETGRRIELNDPMVAAALINSKTLLRAGEIATNVIEAAARGMVEELIDASRAERDAAKAASESVASAVTQVNDAARVAGEAEGARLKASLGEAVERALLAVRREALTDAPAAWKLKIALAIAAVGVVCIFAGGVIGFAIGDRRAAPSLEETRELAAGRDFLAVLPKLDSETKNRIVKLINERR